MNAINPYLHGPGPGQLDHRGRTERRQCVRYCRRGRITQRGEEPPASRMPIADSEREANSLDCRGRACRLIILVRLLLFLHPAAGEKGPCKRNGSPAKSQAVSVRRLEHTSTCCPHAARTTGGTRRWRWHRPAAFPARRQRLGGRETRRVELADRRRLLGLVHPRGVIGVIG